VLPLELGAHRLLGDGRSAALLRPDGEVVWWCAPDVDSPPVLWSLLDPGGAGARWCDALAVSAAGPPAGPALATTLRVRGHRIECRDGLLPLGPGETPALVRLVRAVDAPLAVAHEVARGALGEAVTRQRVDVVGPRGQWAGVVLDTGGQRLADDPAGLLARLDAADRAVERTIAGAYFSRSFGERSRDALRVLTACRYLATGAVIASPTTSLPESVGGDRQFDYRYTWVRDASLAVSAASLLGQGQAARSFLGFAVAHIGGGDPLSAPPVLSVRGDPVPAEVDVDGLAGWADSRPVRIGNGAGKQVQHDTLGLLTEAVSVHVQTGGKLEDRTWSAVRRAAGAVAGLVLAGPPPPTAGIWELRTPARLLSEDVARWVTLDRALWIGRGWRPWSALVERRRWRRARAVVRDRVLAALRPDGTLPGSYDGDAPDPDAAALFAVVFGLLGRGDPRAGRLVDATLQRLGSGPWIYRYPPAGDRAQGSDGSDESDGCAGREGAFLPASILAVSALAVLGRVAEANERMDAICATLPRLLSEMVDPADGRSLGNTPLLWSHMELVRALYLLDVARLRQRWGSVGLTVWRGVRYVRLRRRSDDD
jgi:hypothetical protein